MKNMRLFTLLMLSVTMLDAGVTKTGTTAAKFLNLGVGPRTVAMGGAYAFSENDPGAVYWNPAGIGSLTRSMGLFTQTRWIADINLNFMTLAIPMAYLGVVAASVTAVTMPDMKETTEYYPEGTGNTFGAGMYAVGLSYARPLTDKFIMGATIKYVRENISNSFAQGLALDIGTVFTTPFSGIRFATAITNFGTKMRMSGDDLLFQNTPDPAQSGTVDKLNSYYETDAFDMPLRLQIGLSRDFRIGESQKVLLAVDAGFPSDNTQYMNMGAEWSWGDLVFLRAGFKSLFLKDREEGLTLGAAVKYQSVGYMAFALDYAYQQLRFLGDVHTFGINVGF
ncbi:MAG: hypothetical protein D6677_00625 [Calditrichaeota bacterium]|nr:MAG: hypothetical protein D6677_00625 [Calditrichota bacterium]